MPRVSIRTFDGPELHYRLNGDRVTIGRSPSCDLVVADLRASGRHAELRRSGKDWLLADSGSRNGTLCNGRSVVQPVRLADGDRIEIGSARLVFQAIDPPGEELAHWTPDTLDGGARMRLSQQMRGVLVGSSPAMVALRAKIARVAPTDASVLVRGENGTGKELVARLIHDLSSRAHGPYQPVNCPALPANLVEAELFGVERGVATGVEGRIGRLEQAQGGTLFLDEVADLDLAAQAKLLRFLQERVIERVGGRTPVRLDVRVVSATNRDLEAAMASGTFRRDFYHRLNGVTLHLPPLRERPGDVAELVDAFLLRHPGETRTLAPEALAALAAYDYPGNVRELEGFIESLRILADGTRFEAEHLPEVVLHGHRTPAARAEPSAAVGGAGPPATTGGEVLYQRVVANRESFWTAVRDPFVRGRLPREEVAALLLRVYRQVGGTQKRAAETLGLTGAQAKRFQDFVGHHRLRVKDLLGDPGRS